MKALFRPQSVACKGFIIISFVRECRSYAFDVYWVAIELTSRGCKKMLIF